LIFISFSSYGETSRKISLDFDEYITSTTPPYCESIDNFISIDEGECRRINEYSKNDEISHLVQFSSKLSRDNLRNDLMNLSIRKLLKTKYDLWSAFPSFISHTVSDENFNTINKCDEENKTLGLKEYWNELTGNFSNKKTKEVEAKQKAIVIQAMLDSLKVNAVWDSKKQVDDELEKSFEKRRQLEMELKVIEDFQSGEFQKKQSKRVTSNLVGMTSNELIVSSRSKKMNQEIKEKILHELDLINISIKNLIPKREHLNEIVFSNPYTIESTSVFESGKIKKSEFLNTVVEGIQSIKNHSKITQSGPEFIKNVSNDFITQKYPDKFFDQNLRALLDFVLENDKKLFETLLEKAQVSTHTKIEEISESIKQICETKGEKLHHFKPLVREALIHNLSLAKKENINLNNTVDAFQDAQCEMISEVPYTDSHLGIYGAIGAGMLATGVLAPVGAGVVLVAGGIAFSSVGAYETYNAYNSSNLSLGLAHVNLADEERAREDLSLYRSALGWSIADGLLLPLDFGVVKKVVEQTNKIKIKNKMKEIDKMLPKGGASPSQVTEAKIKPHLHRSQLSYSNLKRLENREIDPVELKLRNNKPKFVSPLGGGVNNTSIVSLEGGIRAVWKPHEEIWSSNYRAEVLAYELSKRLNLNIVPPTVERTLNGQKGSLQLFVKKSSNFRFDDIGYSKQFLFDFIIDNRDRHNQNFFFTDAGEIVSIDNGLSFTGIGGHHISFFKRRRVFQDFLKTDEGKKIIRTLKEIDLIEFKKEMIDYLGVEDAERLIKRIEFLLKYNEKHIAEQV